MTKTIHRFFVAPNALHEEGVVIDDREQVHQITRVLRLREGDSLVVLTGEGTDHLVKIMEVSPRLVRCRYVDSWPSRGEPPVRIRLLQGIPKQPSKFEEVLRHGTEIGISEFYPLLTEHSQADERLKLPRLHMILKEAAEQSERGMIPLLGPTVDFSAVLENGWPEALNADFTILAHSDREVKTSLAELLAREPIQSSTTLNVLIGPEGGFSEKEAAAAAKRGFFIFGLGPRILRTETAGVAVVSALLLGRT